MKNINKYDYPKQILLNEKLGTKIYRKLEVDENSIEVDDYQWQIVSTITDKSKEKDIYSLIQHEDTRLGWINFKESIQIFRFEPEISRFIDNQFRPNSINEKLNINKDFRTHFEGKLLSIKSEITYEGQRLLGVFVKDKFFGFHDEKYFEKLIECNIKLPKELITNKDLFKTSKMYEPVTDEVNLTDPVIISVFKKSNIGKVKVNNKEYYWIFLDGLEQYTSDLKLITTDRSLEQKYIDDMFYAVNKERKQSKEIVKTVLSLKEYMKTRNANGSLDYDIASNNELIKEIDIMKNKIDKLKKELKLSETRLEQQRDYNKRLESQKNKYKDRMNLLEVKLKKFQDKSK